MSFRVKPPNQNNQTNQKKEEKEDKKVENSEDPKNITKKEIKNNIPGGMSIKKTNYSADYF